MSLPDIQELQIGINNQFEFKKCTMKQFDKNSRRIDIYLLDSTRQIIEIPSTYVAKFQATKPDGTIVFDDCTITDNKITYIADEQLTTVYGEVECEIGLYEPDPSGDSKKDKLIQSKTFYVNVEKSAMDRNGVISSDAFNTLTIMINSITGISADAEKAIQDMNTAISNVNQTNTNVTDAENVRVSSENTRISNESTRESAENTRISNENTRKTIEQSRVNAESGRVANENTRTSNESTRENQESTRQSNETIRQNQEGARQEYYNAYKVCEAYDNLKAYVVGNKVIYQGSTYQNILASTGILPTSTTNWILIAAKGIDGVGGDMKTSIYDPTGRNTDIFAHDTKDDTVTFAEATTESDIATGEKHSTLFGKILKSLKTIKTKIGDLTQLQTTSNTDLVSSINEINAKFVINIKDYGAKGDGITDDTIAIQNAINDIPSSQHGEIKFSKGTYLLTGLSSLDSNCHLYLHNIHYITFRGEGKSTILKANSTNKDLFGVTGGSSNITIENMILDRISGASEGGNGIHFYNWYACPKWVVNNVIIRNQYDGLLADTSRPQGSFWQSCRFENCTHCGVNLIMNNDEAFDTCTFIDNAFYGVSVGGSETQDSDGAVYLDNCLFYVNLKGGLHCSGTTIKPNCNIFVNGGIFDNNTEVGIYIANTWNVQINTTITWTNGKGMWLDMGANEIRLDSTKISDSSEMGLYITSGARIISGSGMQITSNGRSSSQSYYGVHINGNVLYCMFSGCSIGNGYDTPTITRNTQDGGFLIEGTTEAIPNYIELIGITFPNLSSNRFTTSGTVGGGLHLLEAQGMSLALQGGQYFGFAGSSGGARVRYNPNTANIESESNIGASSGAWNGSHFVLGNYHIWVTSAGKLMIKNGLPSSETDGTIVGAQA